MLLIDPDKHVLLFEDSDQGLPERPTFWITPGGGIDVDEAPAEAALREVAEKTGYQLAASALRGPIAHRTVVHGYSHKIVEQAETFFAAHVPRFMVDTTGHTADEVWLLGHRWWALEELGSPVATVWPTELAVLLAAVVQRAPWPVELADHEESTVPVR